MKMIKNINKQAPLMLAIVVALTANSFADGLSQLIPQNGSSYYQIGGGDVTPLPYDSGQEIDLSIDGNAGLGFNCGAFNPGASIINSLNGLQNSFGSIQNTIYSDLTGMIIGEGGYLLAKAMPNVYKFARDGMEFGQNQLSLSTTSCDTMLDSVDQGQNPNQDMMNVAMGQDWQYHMSMAGSQAAEVGMLGAATGDIVEAKAQIDQDAGKNGVQWVQGIERNGQLYAGGLSQPPIQLTFDTVVAGYNILIGEGRAYNDTSAPLATDANAGITSIFATPSLAATWAEYVIGEDTITTYSGGNKVSTPGQGVLHYIATQTALLKPLLTKLVTGQTPLTLKALQALDSPKITISSGVILALQKINDPTLKAIWVNRIAEGIAANQVINNAELIRQLLLVGSQAPAIAENSAAQTGIQTDLQHLNAFINSVRQGPQNTKTFLAGSITTLLHSVQNQELASASTQPSLPIGPDMQDGAIKPQE